MSKGVSLGGEKLSRGLLWVLELMHVVSLYYHFIARLLIGNMGRIG